MNDKEKKKLAKIQEEKPTTLSLISEKQVSQMQENILELSKSIKSYLKEHKDILGSLDQSVIKSIKENAKTLEQTTDAVTALAIANNTENIKVQEKAINDITKALGKLDKIDLSKVTITNPTDTSELAKSKDFIGLEKAIVQVSQRVNDLTETLKPNQAPEEFIPYRRVKKRGNQFVFDDDDYSRGGGGGSSSSSTGGNVVITDAGGEAATVTGGKLDVNATASLAGDAIPAIGVATAVSTQIVDGSGNQITSFGGGTQYTEDAAAAANPTGTALNLIRDDALAGGLTTTDGDNVAARGNNKGELYVKHNDSIPITDNGGSLTVDGSVTANAGTNLNTSLLALEAGGNLAAAATSLAALDNSVDGNYLNTNMNIAGTDVDGNSGNKSAQTLRVVIATDQPQLTNSLKVDGSAVTQPVSGTVAITQAAPTTLRYGQKTVSVTNTAVQLDAGACSGVVVQALAANAGNVVIGDSSVTTANGMQLQPGQATGIAIDNVNRVYVNGTAGDGVCWIGS